MKTLTSIYESFDEAQPLILNSEKAFDGRISEIAREICDSGVRCLTLAGPTCSGKTTTASKLTAALEKNGRRCRVVSVDDFYYGKEEMEKRGITDIEGPASINIPLFEEASAALCSGRETYLPVFDFKTRTSHKGFKYTPHKNDIYIFEGIQAVYPDITRCLDPFSYKSIFINVEEGMKIGESEFDRSEIRLIRRTVRDNRHRNTPPPETMRLWRGVRENEEKNIYPFVKNSDHTINSLLDYELLLMSRYYIAVTENYPADDEYAKEVVSLRERLLPLCRSGVTIDAVPESSHIREFAD